MNKARLTVTNIANEDVIATSICELTSTTHYKTGTQDTTYKVGGATWGAPVDTYTWNGTEWAVSGMPSYVTSLTWSTYFGSASFQSNTWYYKDGNDWYICSNQH